MITTNEAGKKLAEAADIAQFRFALIAPVIHDTYSDRSATEYYKRITSRPLTLPDGSSVIYSYKTIEKWTSMYRHGGIDALMPQDRSDKGATRAIPDSAIEEIYRVKEAYPRLNATQIHRHLIEQSFLPATVSVCAVQRYIKRHDLKGALNPNMRDRKAFEEDSFGRMWQCDTCYLPHITEDGKTRRVYCIMIIDDHSRLLVGGGLFYSDSAYNFQKVFKNAVATYGIPEKLYADNGAPYANEQLKLICGSLGTILLHTKVRDGASKAKIERSWRTLKETWLYGIDIGAISSLAQFNDMLMEYMRSYNAAYHTGIKERPIDRYTRTKQNIRHPESSEWLDDCFLNRMTRKVRRDATVSIDKQSYDVPMQFISQTVQIRYLPDDLNRAFILGEDKTRYPIRLTNKVENCHTKRNNVPSLDYARMGGQTNVE